MEAKRHDICSLLSNDLGKKCIAKDGERKQREGMFIHTNHKAYTAQGQQEVNLYKGNMGVFCTIPATFQ